MLARFSTLCCLLAWWLLGTLGALAQAPHTQSTVTTPDGVRIAIQEHGNPRGPAIVFIHGLFGSHLTWQRQLASPELQGYRLITYDLRGHGQSGKPTAAAAYQQGPRWGDELHAVLAATHAQRPVVVAWSMGATVLTNYLHRYGDAQLAGALCASGVIELAPTLIKPRSALNKALFSNDLQTYLLAVEQYVHQGFYQQPDAAALALLYGAGALASPDMTKAVLTSLTVPAAQALPAVKVPVRLVYGQDDGFLQPAMARRAHQLLPRATLVYYPRTGHTPFFEQPARFNQELTDFVQLCHLKSR